MKTTTVRFRVWAYSSECFLFKRYQDTNQSGGSLVRERLLLNRARQIESLEQHVLISRYCNRNFVEKAISK